MPCDEWQAGAGMEGTDEVIEAGWNERARDRQQAYRGNSRD